MQAHGAEAITAALTLDQARAQADLRVSKQQARPMLCSNVPELTEIQPLYERYILEFQQGSVHVNSSECAH